MFIFTTIPMRRVALSGLALTAAALCQPAQAQLTLPDPITLEVVAPLETRHVVYQKLAPSKIGGPFQARVNMQVKITNTSGSAVTLNSITIMNKVVSNFVAADAIVPPFDPAGEDDPIVRPVIQPGKSYYFENCLCDGARSLVVDLPTPATATIKVKLVGSATQYARSVAIKAWDGAPLQWAGEATDLRSNESWGASSDHLGWGQTFALDTHVIGWNGNSWSNNFTGAPAAAKEGRRVYGMPVHAMHDGIVCYALNDHEEKAGVNSTEPTISPSLGAKSGGGNAVKIRTGDFYTLYAHMQRWSLPVELVKGTVVQRGQYIGKVGNSGSTSGPHLHIHYAKVDPGTPAGECDGGVVRPMQFGGMQSLTRTEATTKAKDGTLAADDWTHLDQHSAPHSYGGLNPTTDDFQFCADCTDVKSYLGVWRKGTEIDIRVKIPVWSDFVARHASMSADGFRLRKIESFIENGERQYLGLYKRGSGPYALWQGAGWNAFLAVWNDQYSKGAHLLDIESYEFGGKRYYLGVFGAGSGVPSLILVNSWTAFTNQWNTLSGQGKRLIDVETYVNGSNRMHIGVFEQASGGHALRQLNGYSAFAADWSAQTDLGLRLASVESYVSGNDRWYIGIYRAGSGGSALHQIQGYDKHWQKAEDLNYQEYRIGDIHVLQ